jgi:hypothetical protein
VAQLVQALHYKPDGHGFDSPLGKWNFLLTYFFRLHYGRGVDSASTRLQIWKPQPSGIHRACPCLYSDSFILLLLLLLTLLLFITFITGVYNCIPQTNHVSRIQNLKRFENH